MRTVCRTLTVLVLLVAGPARGQHDHAAPATDGVPLFDDLGTHHHTITTRVPQAQRYFDQGLRLVYAFNHDEAIRAFREAARLDPTCAMAWWGIALASGGVQTVGGLLLQALGRIPRAGERFTLQGLEFDILAATPTRVERVAVRPGPVRAVPLDRADERT